MSATASYWWDHDGMNLNVMGLSDRWSGQVVAWVNCTQITHVEPDDDAGCWVFVSGRVEPYNVKGSAKAFGEKWAFEGGGHTSTV